MKVFNSRDLDWGSARRNLDRAFYHSSDSDNTMFQGTKKFDFPACPNFLKKKFPQNFHLPFGQVEDKIH